ncbi:dTMP kinase [bacterium]|nr:dTMP kinase [bacterium]
MAKKKNKGKFIVFEGIEGCGKTTQIQLLKQYLSKKGLKVLFTKEPGDTPLGKRLRKILLHQKQLQIYTITELMLSAADRAQHITEIILPALKSNKLVISDRYTISTWCYQGYAGGIKTETIEKINSIATLGIEPDIVFILDIDPKEGFRRKKDKKDRFESRNMHFHQKVRKGYLVWAKKNPKKAVVLNGHQSPVKIHQLVLKELKKRSII